MDRRRNRGRESRDQRLNKRFALVLDRLSDKPSVSIPAACRGLAETTAAYRLFDSGRVDAGKISEPHRQATLERVRQPAVVLISEDTTEVERMREFAIAWTTFGPQAKRRKRCADR